MTKNTKVMIGWILFMLIFAPILARIIPNDSLITILYPIITIAVVIIFWKNYDTTKKPTANDRAQSMSVAATAFLALGIYRFFTNHNGFTDEWKFDFGATILFSLIALYDYNRYRKLSDK